MIKVILNGNEIEANPDETIIKLCQRKEITIPHLCYHPDLEPLAKCRICIVDVNGKLVTSCNTKVAEGMTITTENEEIDKARKLNMELLISNHDIENEDNELARLARDLGVTKTRFSSKHEKFNDKSSPAITIDNNKCILCGRCVQKCQLVQTVNAIGFMNRSYKTEISPYNFHGLVDTVCVQCGQCTNVCPSQAIHEKENINQIKKALLDPGKIVVVQTAPTIRATLGETQGMPAGSLVTGKMVAALRSLGFDKVLDTNFAADLTIVEEANELIERVKNKGILPMITSCSPGWVKFIEHFYPELLPHLSSCKSPQQMFGALLKTYYAEKNMIPPSKIVSVSVMPCTAKKYELQRPEMNDSGYEDVDYSLTTRELGRMIKGAGIDFKNLSDEDFDPLMGMSTGAGAIFGATGGVMEAAIRTAVDTLEGKEMENIEYQSVRGLDGVKEATVNVAGMDIHVGVAHGLGNARKLLDLVKNEPSRFHFIEIMACVGGCVGGGGQPAPTSLEIIKKRSEAIYAEDKRLGYRKSHKNPEVIKLYDDFLGKPGGHEAHELLHTKYTKRNKF